MGDGRALADLAAQSRSGSAAGRDCSACSHFAVGTATNSDSPIAARCFAPLYAVFPIAQLLFAAVRALQEVWRSVWNLPSDFGTFRQLSAALRQVADEDLLNHHFQRDWIWESQKPSADKE